MADYITIDGGTTNTRVCLVKNNKITDKLLFCVGARAGIDDNALLKRILKTGITDILEKNNMSESDVKAILASGMITSEFGLCVLPHICVPAGIKELHQAMERRILSDITNIPFVFMRGVKMCSSDIEKIDMMRGEETELMGIMEDDERDCVYVLPDSHSKIIRVDEEGRISEFSSMLTGEMVEALSQHTILKDAVSLENAQLEEDYLMQGYEYACKKGINEALFKVRVLKNILDCDLKEIYSFFIGAVLCGEVKRIQDHNPRKIVLGGKKPLREALKKILVKKSSAEIRCLSDEKVNNSSTMGMIRIYEYNKEV